MSALYRELILEHWREPRQADPIQGATHHGTWATPTCGDSVEVDLRLEDDIVTAISMRVSGCALSTAAGSIVAEELIGKSVADALALNEKSVQALVGGATPTISRANCLMLGTRALQQALRVDQ